MKKLLFGLGAVAAVVTPVVAVVSCGSSKDESVTEVKTQADATKLLAEKGYADIAAPDQAKIFDQLKGKEFSVVHGLIAKDKETHATHGFNDFAILIKGTPKVATDAQMVDEQAGGWLETNHVLLAEAPTVADDQTTADNEAAASTLIARWGFTDEMLKNVEHVIFLQKDDNTTGAKPTAELMSVYKSPAHFGLGDFSVL